MSRALGRYELLRPLARGGMAEVYLARRRAAGVEKFLVVKRIRPERSGDVRFLDMFVKEARLSMSLAHQNIVPVFDFGRIDDQVFLAMERVEGKDLSSCLTRAGDRRLPPMLAAFIGAECCQALDYAHRRKSPEGTALGIVHRDVTPRNVLLSWSGEVKLTDFGIASLAGDSTTQLIGTPGYMAPEQARGEPVDARADVYALGLILREALTAVRARPGTDRDSLMDQAKSGRLAPWPTGTTGPLVTIIDHATAALPRDRYSDARAMLADLDSFIVGERSAHKGDAPARALAAWLDAIWVGDREDEGEGDIDAQHLVSFLDDGAVDVIGTGTERSMLATEADEVPPKLTPGGAPVRNRKPDGLDTDPIPRPRRWVLPMLLAGAAAAGAGAVAALRGAATEDSPTRGSGKPAVVIASVPADATQQPTLDSPVVQIQDAGSVGSASAGSGDGATKVERPKPGPIDRPPPIRSGSNTDPKLAGSATAVVLRSVRINATPWANFTVDDDPRPYETPETVQLTPGRHTIHFKNPVLKVQREATITVPDDRDMSYVQQMQPASD